MNPKPVAMLVTVKLLFDNIQRWLYQKSSEPAFQKRAIEDMSYLALYKQATPFTVNGFTILAFFGERVALE